jgi:hypothetical protein
MHNYYNIIPSLLLDILVIFFLEGIVFYKFIFPMEKNLAANQLTQFNTKLKAEMTSPIIQKNLDDASRQALQTNLDIITKTEKDFIKQSNNYYIMVFGLFCLGLLVLVSLYYYICKNTLGVTINWSVLLISLFLIVVCIIGFEITYFINILLKKKINDKRILQDFMNDLLS